MDAEKKDRQVLQKMMQGRTRVMPDGLVHLANGKVVDQQGHDVDQSEWVQTSDRFDDELDKENEEQKKR